MLKNVSVGGSLHNEVVIGWASHEDAYPYIGYNAANVQQQLEVFNTTPNGGLAGIWMAGNAPAVDASDNLYVATGNGTFDADLAGNDYGDSLLRISSTGAFTLTDYFTPNNQGTLNQYDADLGSGGIVLLPDQTSGPTHLRVQGGKQGLIYLLDRDHMGRFQAASDNVVQEFQADNGSWTTPVFWQNALYIAGSGDHGSCDSLKSYAFTPSTDFNTAASSSSSHCFLFLAQRRQFLPRVFRMESYGRSMRAVTEPPLVRAGGRRFSTLRTRPTCRATSGTAPRRAHAIKLALL